MSFFKGIIAVISTTLMLQNCYHQETLQGYFVENQEMSDFVFFDIPISFVSFDDVVLTEDQRIAYQSINKLNILGYSANTTNHKNLDIELKKVNTLLKNKKYQELFRAGNSSDGKLLVKYIGKNNIIDELVIFTSANDKGFAIIRVLGDNMDLFKILKLAEVIDQFNTNQEDIKYMMSYFL